MDSVNNTCKLGSDAWLELQAFKTRQLNRREKLNRHKNLHKDLVNGIVTNQNMASSSAINPAAQAIINHANFSKNNNNSTIFQTRTDPIRSTNSQFINHANGNTNKSLPTSNNSVFDQIDGPHHQHDVVADDNKSSLVVRHTSNQDQLNNGNYSINHNKDSMQKVCSLVQQAYNDLLERNVDLDLVECLLLLKLCDVALKLPIDSRSLQRSICRIKGLETTTQSTVENFLQKFAHQELIMIYEPTDPLIGRHKQPQVLSQSLNFDAQRDTSNDDEACIYVTSADHTKLVEFDKSYGSIESIRILLLKTKTDETTTNDESCDILTGNQAHHQQSSSNGMTVSEDFSSDDRSELVPKKRSNSELVVVDHHQLKSPHQSTCQARSAASNKQEASDDLESLLSLSSTKERESKKLGEELLELLSKPTAKERNLIERFRSADGYQVQEFCAKGTKGECNRNNKGAGACDKLHFKKIIAKHTEESLGDCSFLNTCFHMDSCKYVHYEVDYDNNNSKQQHTANCKDNQHSKQSSRDHHKQHNLPPNQPQAQFKRPQNPLESHKKLSIAQRNNIHDNKLESSANSKTDRAAAGPSTGTGSQIVSVEARASLVMMSASGLTLTYEEQVQIDAKNRKRFKTVLNPPQWIQCDLRFFDMSLLGKFSVVMADPPWDIHMELPYGTMSDDEMRKLNIPTLQDEGVIFLWVTGRAMELGRECLALWGYERCDEIIWVKTNQLQRIIRTGRTGHWLNHGKEHCLVGVKGQPRDINRGLDCDVIVAEVRATSHKPDEIYGIIERLSPGTRKIELFGRAHNVQPNWITLGNQLNGVKLVEPNLIKAFKKLNLPFQTGDNNNPAI